MMSDCIEMRKLAWCLGASSDQPLRRGIQAPAGTAGPAEAAWQRAHDALVWQLAKRLTYLRKERTKASERPIGSARLGGKK